MNFWEQKQFSLRLFQKKKFYFTNFQHLYTISSRSPHYKNRSFFILDLIDFGCIYIYTCSRNCWADQCNESKQEAVIVHAGPDPRS